MRTKCMAVCFLLTVAMSPATAQTSTRELHTYYSGDASAPELAADYLKSHPGEATSVGAAHIHHGGVQGADHDEVGQQPHAQGWKGYERQACRDRAAHRPDKRNPIRTGRELVSELLKGLPHPASESEHTGSVHGEAACMCPLHRAQAEG